MKTIEVKIEFDGTKFIAIDKDFKQYYTAKRKSDVKTSIKRSKKYDLEVVEEFQIKEDSEASNNAVNIDPPAQKNSPLDTTTDEIVPKVKKTKTNKKSKAKYEDYRDYILGLPNNTILNSTSDAILPFCHKFGLKLSKANRNITWEKVLEKMVDEGYLVYKVKSTGKYKKLDFKLHPDIKDNMEEL